MRPAVPAQAVETALSDNEQWEKIAFYTPLRVRHIALVTGISYNTIHSRLVKAGYRAMTSPNIDDIVSKIKTRSSE